MIDNLRAPDFVADPYPAFARWRERGPVIFRTGRADWLVIGYDEILQALNDPRLGHRPKADTAPVDGADKRGATAGLFSRGAAVISRWPMTNDPPEHARLRQPFRSSAALVKDPCVMASLDTAIDSCLEKAADQGGLDVVRDLAVPLTLGLSCEMLGVPQRDRMALLPLVEAMSDGIDVDVSEAVMIKGALAAAALGDYVARLLKDASRVSCPSSVMLRNLSQSAGNNMIAPAEASALGALGLLAGSGTTESLISSAIFNLLRDLDAWRAISRSEALLARALEECLRFDTPAQVVSRHALVDVSLGDATINAGQSVRLLLGAGNRDPRVFKDADRFDADRERRPVLSMGSGIHTCPGAGQARHVAKLVLRRFSTRFPGARLASAPAWRDGFQVRGLKSLRIEI